MKIAIVGAGVAGLAAAFALETARRDGADVDYVVFGEERAGGIVRVVRAKGFVVDAGPDGFVASKPSAAALCRAVGLGDELVETVAVNRRTYVVHRGRLVRMPQGLHLVAPTRLGPIVRTPLLSRRGKARVFEDLAIAPRPEQDGDESIADFVTRRFGSEWCELMAGSLLAGIYAGDPAALSVRSTFPQLVALEREHGSLIRGALALKRRAPVRPPGAPAPSAFLSLRGGMGALVDALVTALPPARVRLGTPVTSLARTMDGVRVHTRDAATDVHRVLLAVPAWAAGPLLAPIESDAATRLEAIDYVSTVSVYLGYPLRQIGRALDATGLLSPRRAGLRMTASTWLSSKWPDRAPEGHALLRVFYGGAHDRDAHRLDDATLVGLAVRELAPLIGLSGAPAFSHVQRHVRASPQPQVGHIARMTEVDSLLARRADVRVMGGGYRGVGIPDTIAEAQRFARDLVDEARRA